MDIPRALRKQLAYYAREGFHAVDIKHAAGAHVKVIFAEFSKPQILTRNIDEPRALKNNLARFRRLAKEQHEQPV